MHSIPNGIPLNESPSRENANGIMQMEVRQIVGDPSEEDEETQGIAGILSNLSNDARFCARSGTCSQGTAAPPLQSRCQRREMVRRESPTSKPKFWKPQGRRSATIMAFSGPSGHTAVRCFSISPTGCLVRSLLISAMMRARTSA